MKALIDMNIDIMKSADPNIPEETLKKLRDAYSDSLTGLSGMGFVWQVGKEKEPAFAGLIGAIHTADAADYLKRYEKSIAAMTEAFKDIKAPFTPNYEVKRVKVNGKPALEMTMEFAAGLGVPEEFEKMIKSLVGADGKMRVSLAARDDKTVIMRYTAADGLKEVLGGTELGSDAAVAQVTKALPPGAQCAFYLNPKGVVEFADRMIKEFSPIPINLPPFGATPPVAVGARVSAEGFDLNIVVPGPVVDNAANFINQLKRMFQGAV